MSFLHLFSSYSFTHLGMWFGSGGAVATDSARNQTLEQKEKAQPTRTTTLTEKLILFSRIKLAGNIISFEKGAIMKLF